MLQGALSYNFTILTNTTAFNQYIDSHYKFLDMIESEEEYEYLFAQFIKVLNCYIEENSNTNENKNLIIKNINPKKLLSVLIYAFKKLWYKLSRGNDYKNAENNIFKEINHNEMIKFYIMDKDSDPLFILSTGIYIYFKRVSLNKIHGYKIIKILDDLKNSSELNRHNIKLLQIIKGELYHFFCKIIKSVEISFKFSSNINPSELKLYKDFFEDYELWENISRSALVETKGIDNVIFLSHPLTLFIEKEDGMIFIENSPYHDFNTKLNFFLDYNKVILHTLKMREILYSYDSFILSFLFRLNYKKMEYVSSFLALITNISMICEFKNLTNNYIIPIMNYTNYISGFHICILIILISNWFGFNIFKQKLDNDFKPSIYTYIQILINQEIFPFVWNLSLGLIALFNDNLRFIYSLQLFTIFNIVPTMSIVLYAVRIRYKQFLSTCFLICIIILFYSCLTFYYFRN